MHGGCAAAVAAWTAFAAPGGGLERRCEAAFQRPVWSPRDLPAGFEPRNTRALPPEDRRGSCTNIHRIRLAQTGARLKATQCEIDDVGVVIHRAGSCTCFLHVCRVHKRRLHAASHSLAQLRLRPRPVGCRRRSNVDLLHQYSILLMSRAMSLHTCVALLTLHRKDGA
jgi:hypothetical protein